MEDIELLFFDDGQVLLTWWTEEGAEIAREVGTGSYDLIDNPWCG